MDFEPKVLEIGYLNPLGLSFTSAVVVLEARAATCDNS